MNSIIDKIRSRGSWTVRIRPIEYQKDRVGKLGELVEAVRTSAVELRGWDFPHFTYKSDPERKKGYIEQQCDWEHYVELWRAYKSGQFISLSTLWGDRRDQSGSWPPCPGWKPGDTLGVENAIFRFVEIFEFAARWVRAVPVGEKISIDCTFRGLKDRSLELSPRRTSPRFHWTRPEDEFKWGQQYSTADLFSTPREHAITPAIALFELFGWDASEDAIRDIQGELRA